MNPLAPYPEAENRSLRPGIFPPSGPLPLPKLPRPQPPYGAQLQVGIGVSHPIWQVQQSAPIAGSPARHSQKIYRHKDVRPACTTPLWVSAQIYRLLFFFFVFFSFFPCPLYFCLLSPNHVPCINPASGATVVTGFGGLCVLLLICSRVSRLLETCAQR